jgi:glycosyltransferase involved in cell wall biosynthesis
MISVVVPAYNAERTIRECLDALVSQDYPGTYEIIVVDDGSKDTTPDIVSEYPAVKLLRQANAGPAAARNRGAQAACGDIILFTDSDCVPEKDWMREMLAPLKDPSIAGVKGIYRTKQRQIVARFVQLEYEDKYDYMRQSEYIDFIDTYSAAFRRDIFLQAGGYDRTFPVACAEDVELSYRLSHQGHRMVLTPRAAVYHQHPGSLLGYLKKKYKFAFWRMLAVKKNPDKLIKDSHTPQLMKLQILFPPAIIVSGFLSAVDRSFPYLAAILLSVFFVSTIPFQIKAFRKDGIVGLLSSPLLFLRALFQFLGVIGGIFYAYLERRRAEL